MRSDSGLRRLRPVFPKAASLSVGPKVTLPHVAGPVDASAVRRLIDGVARDPQASLRLFRALLRERA